MAKTIVYDVGNPHVIGFSEIEPSTYGSYSGSYVLGLYLNTEYPKTNPSQKWAGWICKYCGNGNLNTERTCQTCGSPVGRSI